MGFWSRLFKKEDDFKKFYKNEIDNSNKEFLKLVVNLDKSLENIRKGNGYEMLDDYVSRIFKEKDLPMPEDNEDITDSGLMYNEDLEVLWEGYIGMGIDRLEIKMFNNRHETIEQLKAVVITQLCDLLSEDVLEEFKRDYKTKKLVLIRNWNDYEDFTYKLKYKLIDI